MFTVMRPLLDMRFLMIIVGCTARERRWLPDGKTLQLHTYPPLELYLKLVSL